jgi:hypothetical protein
MRSAAFTTLRIAAVLTVALPTYASARSMAERSVSRDTVARSARRLVTEGGQFGQRRTLRAKSMRELVAWTAPIAKDAYDRYGGDWMRYWTASNARNQRSGKTLEAAIAWRVNAQRERLGIADRMLVTAAEGYPGHAADLVDVAPDGSVLKKYQVKWGWKSTVKALVDPKYRDMSILTTRQSFQTIEKRLIAAEVKAAERGLPLTPKWRLLRAAVESGRLPGEVGGKPLPTAAAVRRYAMRRVKETFFAGELARLGPRSVAEAGHMTATLAGSGRALGKLVIFADVAGTAYAQYLDVQHYRAGEIGGRYLAFKSGLRASQLALAYYAVASPEPATKFVAGIGAGVFIVIDLASDPVYRMVYARRRDASLALLNTIDRQARYHAARAQLLAEYTTPEQSHESDLR